MGMFSDLRASAKGIDFSAPAVGVKRAVAQDLAGLEARIGDALYPSGYAAVNEVQSIAVYVATVDGGTFTLTFTLYNGFTFTTAPIAFGANAATIETAVNVAAALASLPGFTNGDIDISGGSLSSAPLVITFSGASVSGRNHGLTVIDGAELTGGGSAGAVSVSTAGQSNRTALGILQIAGVLAGSPPAQGTSSTVTAGTGFKNNPNRLEPDTVRALANEAAIADANSTLYSSIITAVSLLS